MKGYLPSWKRDLSATNQNHVATRFVTLHVDDWFNVIASNSLLTPEIAEELDDSGFIVIAGAVASTELARLTAAYDAAVAGADSADKKIGSTTTRVIDFVNRGKDFDSLYVYPPILSACCSIIGQPFKLSTMLARTVNPNKPAQAFHVDFSRDAEGWPMVGFIIMVDEFRNDNGATRFVPGSHKRPTSPSDVIENPAADYEDQVLACGPAGSVIIYNGSIWHGHAVNRSSELRRSIQGAYIRRDLEAAVNQADRIRPETLERIGPLAKYLLAL